MNGLRAERDFRGWEEWGRAICYRMVWRIFESVIQHEPSTDRYESFEGEATYILQEQASEEI